MTRRTSNVWEHHELGRVRLVCGVVGLSLACASGAASQGLGDDAFANQVIGEWLGSGEYDGNRLTVTRTWTLELGDHFIRADLRVAMPNGRSFGALMYWRAVSTGVYDVVWMDGLGRSQPMRATRDPDSGVVSATYLDEFAEDGPEWRTWEFESIGPARYEERLYRLLPDGRELLTRFSLERVEG
ncbi:MAG: hypothetical protein OEO23_03505 [Gemmatimonadota bacterium]|nr:hypothetical protein [Gemmatimonadota bacterium]